MYFIKKVPRKSPLLSISSEQAEEGPAVPSKTVGCLATRDLNREVVSVRQMMPRSLRMIRCPSPVSATESGRDLDLKLKNPRGMSSKCLPALGDNALETYSQVPHNNIKIFCLNYRFQAVTSSRKLISPPKSPSRSERVISEHRLTRNSMRLPQENELLHDEFIRNLIEQSSSQYSSAEKKKTSNQNGNFFFNQNPRSQSPQGDQMRPKIDKTLKMLRLKVTKPL